MNSSEDWYQTAIKKFKINEIPYKKFSGKPTRIGRGGFGLIYKIECNSIGTVAIKEITIGIEDDETCIKNFINEVFKFKIRLIIRLLLSSSLLLKCNYS